MACPNHIRIRSACAPASLLIAGIAAAALAAPMSHDRPPAAGHHAAATTQPLPRVLKHFDFDEVRLGNFEPSPMNWEPLVAPGYPPFLRAAFDPSVGHEAAPSVRLGVQGGSVATHYIGRTIPVRAGCDYRVRGWVRTQGLHRAAAVLTAFYRDANQRPIGTEIRSAALRDVDNNGEWTPVELFLRVAPRNARWIAIGMAVEQPSRDEVAPASVKPIRLMDNHGSAWFDDVTITRLPRLGLSTESLRSAPNEASGAGATDGAGAPATTISVRANSSAAIGDRHRTNGAMLDAGRRDAVEVRVEDADLSDLLVTVKVWNGADEPVLSDTLRPVGASSRMAVSLKDLPMGVYRVRAAVEACGEELAVRELSFLRTLAAQSTARSHGGFLGITLGREVDSPAMNDIEPLLTWLGVGAVKLPLWHAGTRDSQIVSGSPAWEAMLNRLRRCDIRVIGTLLEPPASLAERFPRDHRSLGDVLSASPDVWRPYLALPLMRQAGLIDAWQLGADTDFPADAAALRPALMALQAEITTMAGPRPLVVPWPSNVLTARKQLPADGLSIDIPARLRVDSIGEYLATFGKLGFRPLWVHLGRPKPALSERNAAWADWTQRIITARQHGAERVFLDPPWDVGDDGALRPGDEALMLRNLSAILGDARPLGEVRLDEAVTAYVFAGSTPGEGLLAAWADVGPGESREVVTPIGRGTQRFDLWGGAEDVADGSGGQRMRLVREPVIFAPVDPILLAARDNVWINGDRLEAGEPTTERTLVIRNPFERRIHGTAELDVPGGWQLEPRRFEFAAEPGGTFARPLAFRLPRNAAAGEYRITTRLVIEIGMETRGVSLAPRVDVGLRDLDVRVMWQVQEKHLLIQTRIVNRGDRTAELESRVVSPVHPREVRAIPALKPGGQIVHSVTLDRAAELIGTPVRVSLRRRSGPEAFNETITIKMNGDTMPMDAPASPEDSIASR